MCNKSNEQQDARDAAWTCIHKSASIMDRAQELRTLMKQGSAAGGGAAVSGKDKAKLLKMMKEQQKQKVAPAVVLNTVKAAPAAKLPSGIPSNFFDAEQSQPPIASKPLIASASTQQSKPASSTLSASNNNSIKNLPQGFFDNPVEDLNARGITMEQYTAKLEKEEQSALDSFLSDLKGLEGEAAQLEEASEALEEGNREYEEEAMQMAYMANLIALRAQSERLASSNNSNSTPASEETNDVLDKLLKEVGQARTVPEASSSAASAVESILYQKLAKNAANKRKRDVILSEVVNGTNSTTKAADSEDSGSESGGESDSDSDSDNKDGSEGGAKKAKAVKYSPLNYMDWMSRSV